MIIIITLVKWVLSPTKSAQRLNGRRPLPVTPALFPVTPREGGGPGPGAPTREEAGLD